MSRTTWFVITIVGLAAFIVGGGVALVEDGSQPPSASNAPAVSVSSSTPALESPPASNVPSVSLAEDEDEGDENGKGKPKGHDKKGHEGHGKAKGHQNDPGEAD